MCITHPLPPLKRGADKTPAKKNKNSVRLRVLCGEKKKKQHHKLKTTEKNGKE